MSKIIKPPKLAEWLDVHPSTIPRLIAAKTLPPLDVQLTRKTRGWRAETLRRHGVNVPTEAA